MKKYFYLLALLSGLIELKSQIVSTFFNEPTKKIDDAMVIDHLGNLYGSHFMGTNVYKISPLGVSSVFATGFNTPNGLAFDSQHNLYVCDLSGNKIYKLSYSGTFLDTIPIQSPSGIIKSFSSDTMLFTQYTGNKLSKLAPDGSITLIASGAPMLGSVGLAYDPSGQLYVANFTDRKIFSVNSNTLTYVATVPGPSNGSLGFIAFAKGHLWATGFNDHKIYKIEPNFIDSTVAYAGSTVGSTDGGISSAKFNSPNGIISSISGDSLFVSDFGSGRIRVISFTSFTGMGKNELVQNKIKIYPSPSSNFVSIEYEGEILGVKLYDSYGKLLGSSLDRKTNVSDLPVGLYILSIQTSDGILKTRFLKN